MGLIDLHTHTTASDGSLTPNELVRSAERTGLVAVAVTDHDTIGGVDEALAAGLKFGIRVVPGIELSVNYDNNGGSFHLLAYGMDHHDEPLQSAVSELRRSRDGRNERIIDRLTELGYQIRLEDVLRWSGGGTVGRGHIARALLEADYVVSIDDAFRRLLQKGGPAYVDRYRLNLQDACRLVHNAGGLTVWAHPGLHGGRLERMLEKLPLWVKWGLDGIESDYSQHSIELRDRIRRITERYGLIYTGGSDFHGELKLDIHLGDGPEGQPIDENILMQLDAKLALMPL